MRGDVAIGKMSKDVLDYPVVEMGQAILNCIWIVQNVVGTGLFYGWNKTVSIVAKNVEETLLKIDPREYLGFSAESFPQKFLTFWVKHLSCKNPV